MALQAAASPRRSLARGRAAAEGLGEVLWETLNPAPHTPLNVPIGPHRRFATASCRLSDFKLIKDALGGTVNDVLLAVVAGALRRFLTERGIRTEGLELRALVPVSIRRAGRRRAASSATGSRRCAPRCPCTSATRAGGSRRCAPRWTRSRSHARRWAPRSSPASRTSRRRRCSPQASRLKFTTRLFNVLVTNVPGPQLPLYVLGREMLETYPIAFLPRDHALAVAILSYNGQVNFGLLADHDALPELDQLRRWVGEEVEELVGLAAPALS